MKCISLIGFSMLVIMAGCSKQTEHQPWQADNSDAWKYDESLPVPVQFASQGISITTKGIIEDDSGLEGKSFGIFGLSVQHQEDGTVSPAWNPVNTSQLLLENTEGRLSSGNGNIELPVEVFYPLSDDMTFSFYGYYPYSAEHEWNGNDYYIRYTAAGDDLGNIDILYAKEDAERVDGLDGFNAGYVRTNPDRLPVLDFAHKTVALDFMAVQAGNAQDVSNVTVTGFDIMNAPTVADLYIATITPSKTEAGKLLVMDSGRVSLKKSYDGGRTYTSELNERPHADGAFLGTFLLAPKADMREYDIEVFFRYDNGLESKAETVLSLPNDLAPGTRYTVNLQIWSAESVSMSVDVASWPNTPEDEINIDL